MREMDRGYYPHDKGIEYWPTGGGGGRRFGPDPSI